jgi:hypothetical protein
MNKPLLAIVVKDPVWANWNGGKASMGAKLGMAVQDKYGATGTIFEVEEEWVKVKWEDGEVTSKYIGNGFTPNHSELFTKLQWGEMRKVWVVNHKKYIPQGLTSGFICTAEVFDTKDEVDQFLYSAKPFMSQVVETYYRPTNAFE